MSASRSDVLPGTAVPAEASVRRHARAVVLARADEPVRDVARRMGQAHTSCAVVTFPDGLGVVTDTDIRRLVGTGEVPPGAPVAHLSSRPALCVAADATLVSALEMIARHGVHHLVVVDGEGRPDGVLRAVDLASAEAGESLAVRAAVDAARTLDELAGAAARIPATAVHMWDAGVPASTLTALLSDVHESLLRRVIAFGAPRWRTGVRSSWLVLGSLARREVLPSSDIDTALVWEQTPEAMDEAVRAEAARTLDDLERVGQRRCPDGANADNPLFARSVLAWRAAAGTWAEDLAREAGPLLVTMVAGSRPVTEPDLGAQVTDGIRDLTSRPALRRALLQYLLASRPPLRLQRTVIVEHTGEHRGQVNLKRAGLRPVRSIGTWVAIVTGDTSGTTAERLRRAIDANLLTPDEGQSLLHAHELILNIVLTEEIDDLRTGQPAATWIDPARLDSLRRRHLREALRAIARVQGHLDSEWAPRWRAP
jgi:CBS domain-containing protein